MLSKFLNKICAVASSRSVSLLISGQKKPAKLTKTVLKRRAVLFLLVNYIFLQYKHGLLLNAVLLLGIYGHQYDTHI